MNFPREILREIFSKFESYRICYKGCSLVCKYWMNCLKDPVTAQYMIKAEYPNRDIRTELYQRGWQYYLPISLYPTNDMEALTDYQNRIKEQCQYFLLNLPSNKLDIKMVKGKGLFYLICRLAIIFNAALTDYHIDLVVLCYEDAQRAFTEINEVYCLKKVMIHSFGTIEHADFHECTKHIFLLCDENHHWGNIDKWNKTRETILKNNNKMINISYNVSY